VTYASEICKRLILEHVPYLFEMKDNFTAEELQDIVRDKDEDFVDFTPVDKASKRTKR
jgi:hypothetical protein